MAQQQDYKYIRGPRCEPSNEEAHWWQLPVHHKSYPRQTRQLYTESINVKGSAQPTASHACAQLKYMTAKNAAQPISNASSSIDAVMLSTAPTQPMAPTSQQQHSRCWQHFGEPRNWGNTHIAERGHNAPKGGGPVKYATGYGDSWGKSWPSYDSDGTQTHNQDWAGTSSVAKSSEANHSAGCKATAVAPWYLAPARASQMNGSQTRLKAAGADAKGASGKRRVVQWPSEPIVECCDESSSAEETVAHLADFLLVDE